MVPEYAATFTEYLNLAANGPDAEPVATGDVDETVQALRSFAEDRGLTVLEPAQAANQKRLLRHRAVRRAARPGDAV
jgi:osmoprotectant transport system substrate-binding protein